MGDGFPRSSPDHRFVLVDFGVLHRGATGAVPEELEAVDITTNKPKETESGFVELVGQISLNTLEKADRPRDRFFYNIRLRRTEWSMHKNKPFRF